MGVMVCLVMIRAGPGRGGCPRLVLVMSVMSVMRPELG